MKTLRTLLLAAPFLLAACDGYEMVRVDSFPYGNQRTAGTGVAYVLAKMAPEKEMIAEPAMEETKEAIEDVKKTEEIEKIEEKTFTDAQKK